ncbi:hypothetical protein DFP72DRAFT_632369 [Ephemerocybe angulata]|uniref:Uncharacterized protein n=1 Tax=Ephemerocybe angulata TaxID=980116 RepID=A0A8H6ME77_9AGAR|nr:hypothetical protein DFP72DRAFT_632369 [Tulosesus angulatus]
MLAWVRVRHQHRPRRPSHSCLSLRRRPRRSPSHFLSLNLAVFLRTNSPFSGVRSLLKLPGDSRTTCELTRARCRPLGHAASLIFHENGSVCLLPPVIINIYLCRARSTRSAVSAGRVLLICALPSQTQGQGRATRRRGTKIEGASLPPEMKLSARRPPNPRLRLKSNAYDQ